MADAHSKIDRAPGGLEPLADLSPARVWGMLESAPDAMLMTDEDGVILGVNRQVETIFGYDRVDLLGRSVEILLPEQFRDVHTVHRERYRVSPSVRSMGVGLDLLALRRDGTEFPVEVSLSPLRDADGVGVVVSVRDVSERMAAEAKLTRIQQAIDAVHDGVFMFEVGSLEFVYVNEGAIKQTGYSREELLTMSPVDIKPEFTHQQFEQLIAPLISGEVDVVSFRTLHRHKSGHDIPVDIMLEHRRTSPERAAGLLVALVRDVTDRVRIERLLAVSEETFRTTFEQAPVGMVLARIDADGNRVIERVNAAFASLLGRSPEGLSGVDLAGLTHPDDNEADMRAAAQLADGSRTVYTTEQRFRRADGSYVWTLLHASVVRGEDGPVSLGHVVDITDRRERQAERMRLANMEDRDRIARDLHDLVIQRLFAAGMNLQAVIPEMGSAVAVERTLVTIDELDVTIRELRSAIFDLHAQDVKHTLEERIRETVESISSSLGFVPSLEVGDLANAAPPVVDAVASTLREALTNVARHAQAHAVDIEIRVEAGVLALVVADDGVGMPADVIRGNGLNNLAERAERLGGTFEMAPADGRGTRLTWTVPFRTS